MSLLIISFLAGMLSVLAPCVLPVLPVILWSSLGTNKRYRPIIIVLSLMFFIVFFTVILKVSTVFINIPESFWTYFSAVIIILYGITLVWPVLWDKLSIYIWLNRANELSDKASKVEWLRWDILLGASLGPIFASCSPTYAILLSLVFPKSFALWLVYTSVYALGFGILLLIVAYSGRTLIRKLNPLANSEWWFKKILGIILIITWVMIASWFIKKVQVWLLESGFWDSGVIENKLLQNSSLLWKKNQNSWSQNINNIYDQNNTWDSKAINSPYLNSNYSAPDIKWLTNWTNNSWYNSLNELKWKVVLIDFWTYSCINCIRTLETMKKRDAAYSWQWLVIIWVHAPEFQFEKNIDNVRKAIKDFDIKYPVAQDNNFATWSSFENHYRPAKYLIDRDGNVRYTHFGEWNYPETEKAIQTLLWSSGSIVSTDKISNRNWPVTPETYLGTNRRSNYSQSMTPEANQRWLEWNRNSNDENIYLTGNTWWSISINAQWSETNLVMWSDSWQTISASIYIDDKFLQKIQISEYKLYNLYKSDISWLHKIKVIFDKWWLTAFAYTFG